MNRDDAKEAVGILQEIEKIDAMCTRLDRQDADPYENRCIGGSAFEWGPLLSADVARKIRALMRDDFLASKELMLSALKRLGVDP